MRRRDFGVNLKGRVKNFNIPYTQSLVPLYEAIVNSMHAIEERKRLEPNLNGKIDITIERISQETIEGSNTMNDIESIIIKDNGIGFNETNYNSFMTSDSEHKTMIGGKGVGRFSWLKVFEKAEIKSNYFSQDENKNKSIIFDFELDNNVNYRIDNCCNNEIGSTIKLINMDKDYQKNTVKTLDTVARHIIEHCIIYLLSRNCPLINISDEENSININEKFKEYMVSNLEEENFELENEIFTLKHIKINERNYSGNTLLLCANDRLVESKNLEMYIPDLNKDIYEKESYWYVGILTSEYLDKNVDMNRLSFNIPIQESDKNLVTKVSINGLTKKSSTIVEKYLQNYLNKVSKEKLEKIEKFITKEAPQYRHLLEYKKGSIIEIKPNISDEKLDDELYKIKREFEKDVQMDAKRLLKEFKEGDINNLEYREKFEDRVQKITSSNESRLAEYILHRKIIIDLLDVTLSKCHEDKYGYEKEVHNLIYPMRKSSNELLYDQHNLWLIDEKLAYSNYISSDIPFNNSPKEDRPDMFFTSGPIAVSDTKNEGSEFETITIFELKRPMRDNYTSSDNPMDQLMKYVERFNENDVRDSNGRLIKVGANTKFYLYAICDITPSLEKLVKRDGLKKTPDNMGYYGYNDNYNSYMEILSYDKINNDAKKRNRVLFDKLGLE